MVSISHEFLRRMKPIQPIDFTRKPKNQEEVEILEYLHTRCHIDGDCCRYLARLKKENNTTNEKEKSPQSTTIESTNIPVQMLVYNLKFTEQKRLVLLLQTARAIRFLNSKGVLIILYHIHLFKLIRIDCTQRN